jgi:hypothetical protein
MNAAQRGEPQQKKGVYLLVTQSTAVAFLRADITALSACAVRRCFPGPTRAGFGPNIRELRGGRRHSKPRTRVSRAMLS